MAVSPFFGCCHAKFAFLKKSIFQKSKFRIVFPKETLDFLTLLFYHEGIEKQVRLKIFETMAN